MDNNEYKNRIETLGYMASDELVKAVQDEHAKQLTDELIDRAYGDLRRAKNPPAVKPAKAKKAGEAKPGETKKADGGGLQ